VITQLKYRQIHTVTHIKNLLKVTNLTRNQDKGREILQEPCGVESIWKQDAGAVTNVWF